MKLAAVLTAAALLAAIPAVAQPAPPEAPGVEVMVVGVFHMSNPGQDMVNATIPDMATPERQAEIQRTVEGLARFQPTAVAVEWPTDVVADRWARYQAGTLPPSRNEVVQLGFRLGKLSGARVYGADADGDFPFQPVMDWAQANGRAEVIQQAMAFIQAEVKAQEQRLATGTVAAELRHMNRPDFIAQGQGFYSALLRMGAGDQQPGADLNAAWRQRNLRICARIIQESRPGDRVVVFFGAGHAYLLRQCVTEQPGYRLVEANAFLPER